MKTIITALLLALAACGGQDSAKYGFSTGENLTLHGGDTQAVTLRLPASEDLKTWGIIAYCSVEIAPQVWMSSDCGAIGLGYDPQMTSGNLARQFVSYQDCDQQSCNITEQASCPTSTARLPLPQRFLVQVEQYQPPWQGTGPAYTLVINCQP